MSNQEAIKRIKEHIAIHKYRESHAIHIVEALEMAISALQAQEAKSSNDTINRQAAIDTVDSETVSTNPEHFKSSEKFIKFMDDADIASFGKWQWANGFNTALVAANIQLKKLPSAQPEPLSDAYMNAVWAWLIDYQIKVAELKGRYTPYEVLSWVANDWRKENEGSD